MSLQHLILKSNAHSFGCQHLQLRKFWRTMTDNNYRDDDADYVTHSEHQVLELRNEAHLLKFKNRGGKQQG